MRAQRDKLRVAVLLGAAACLCGKLVLGADSGGAAGQDAAFSPDSAASPMLKLKVDKRYLNLPVKNGAVKHRLRLLSNGQVAREFDIELADAQPDFWVFLDLAPFAGKEIAITADHLPASSAILNQIEQADTIQGGEDLYQETLRPQFHFSTRRGWNNDPNGLVFYQGEYHLFYQYNPYGWKWGNMHWGHAVSQDLVHWQELPVAIYPSRYGDWVFSGSAAVDWNNTGGFKTGTNDVLVAAYTSVGRGECIAFSNDRGRKFSDYDGNPVVKHRGRDPRIFWHQPSGQWVMAVYDERPNEPDNQSQRGIAFYSSPNLKHWTFQSRIAGFFECPDLFELPVDGNPGLTKWVLTAASSEYMLGQFDGRVFTPETPKLPGHRGSAFYAAQTYNNIPVADGRRIQIGWGRVPAPGMPFNQMMAFPCELTLRTLPEGVRLCWQPVREITNLYVGECHEIQTPLTPEKVARLEPKGELLDLQAGFDPGTAQFVELNLHGASVVYDATAQQISCGGKTNSLPLVDGKVRLRVLADRTSLEIFANDGSLYMPMTAPYQPGNTAVDVAVSGGAANSASLSAHEMKSAWR